MKLSLSHERLKSEGIGLPFCPYKYIKFKLDLLSRGRDLKQRNFKPSQICEDLMYLIRNF